MLYFSIPKFHADHDAHILKTIETLQRVQNCLFDLIFDQFLENRLKIRDLSDSRLIRFEINQIRDFTPVPSESHLLQPG